MRIAARDADIAQSCVAQSFKLASGTGPPLPFREAEFEEIPMGKMPSPEGGHRDGAHGWLRIPATSTLAP
jgi:hypothetical protein